jgi:hypothetical protein
MMAEDRSISRGRNAAAARPGEEERVAAGTRAGVEPTPRDRRGQHPAPHVIPHPLANELIDESDLVPDVEAATPPDERHLAPQTDRRVGRMIWLAAALAIVAGVIVAAIFFRSLGTLWFAAGFAAAYAVFVLAPILLAIGTRITQDEEIKEERLARGEGPR